jgi:hypothetical protein
MELITAKKIRKVCVLLVKYVCQSFTAKIATKEGLIIQIDKNDSVYNTETHRFIN